MDENKQEFETCDYCGLKYRVGYYSQHRIQCPKKKTMNQIFEEVKAEGIEKINVKVREPLDKELLEYKNKIKTLVEVFNISSDRAEELLLNGTIKIGDSISSKLGALTDEEAKRIMDNAVPVEAHVVDSHTIVDTGHIDKNVVVLKSNPDGRNEVTKKALENLAKTMFEQDDYGMEKYKEPLHHSYKYDWLEMAMQEEADKLKYLQCERERKEEVVAILTAAKRCYSQYTTHDLIQRAIDLLTAGGRENKQNK